MITFASVVLCTSTSTTERPQPPPTHHGSIYPQEVPPKRRRSAAPKWRQPIDRNDKMSNQLQHEKQNSIPLLLSLRWIIVVLPTLPPWPHASLQVHPSPILLLQMSVLIPLSIVKAMLVTPNLWKSPRPIFLDGFATLQMHPWPVTPSLLDVVLATSSRRFYIPVALPMTPVVEPLLPIPVPSISLLNITTIFQLVVFVQFED